MLETTENAVYPLFFPFCFSFLPFISSSMPGKPRPPHRLYHTRVTLFSYTPVSRRFFSFFFFYFFFSPPLLSTWFPWILSRGRCSFAGSIDFPGNEGDWRDIKNREQPGDERRLLFAVIECDDRWSAEKTLERIDLVDEERRERERRNWKRKKREKVGKRNGRMAHCARGRGISTGIGLSSCAWLETIVLSALCAIGKRAFRGAWDRILCGGSFFFFYYSFNSHCSTRSRAKWKRILRDRLIKTLCQSILSRVFSAHLSGIQSIDQR